jgi:hypothetical protein
VKIFAGTTLFWLLFFSGSIWAQKVTLDVGFYSINAVGPSAGGSGNVSLSTPGAYSLSAGFAIRPQWELSPGYTVFYSKIFQGDMGFGPDFYLHYYPFNAGNGLKYSEGNISYYEKERWRPFASVSFHQRQFQSVQSSYSGFGFDFGSEFQISKITSTRLMMRMMTLAGPSGGSLTYMDLLLGYQFQF